MTAMYQYRARSQRQQSQGSRLPFIAPFSCFPPFTVTQTGRPTHLKDRSFTQKTQETQKIIRSNQISRIYVSVAISVSYIKTRTSQCNESSSYKKESKLSKTKCYKKYENPILGKL